MRIGAFEIHEPLPELHRPHAFAMLRPWVDVGSVGSLTLAALEGHLGAHELGRLARPGNFFDFTRYRPTVYYKEGSRRISVPNAYINYAKREGASDLLFFHLLEPHMLGETYADSILKVLARFGAERYCLLGSMYDFVPHTRPLLVTGTSSSAETQEELRGLGVGSSAYQGPTTITFIVSQEAPALGIEVFSSIVHLPQYTQLEEDYAGQLRLLQVLCSLYRLDMNLSDIERKAERQYAEITSAMNKNPEVREIVSQLERHYEAQVRKDEDEERPKLSPEIERFLREINRQFGDS